MSDKKKKRGNRPGMGFERPRKDKGRKRERPNVEGRNFGAEDYGTDEDMLSELGIKLKQESSESE